MLKIWMPLPNIKAMNNVMNICFEGDLAISQALYLNRKLKKKMNKWMDEWKKNEKIVKKWRFLEKNNI